jgi:pimeloyl-ACP methyl ester carboxylesterase
MSRARESSVRVGGLRVHVRDVGEGTPVLLLNGIGAHSAMWAPVEAAFRGVRLIEFDAPGTGRSRGTSTLITIPALASLATHLLDELGVDRADVVGYSLGGIVAQALAIYAPERVRRLVLVSTTPGLGGVPGTFSAMLNVATPLRYYSSTYYAKTIGGMVGGRARHDSQWVARHYQLRRREPPTLLGYAGQLASAALWTSLPLLHRIPHPTLVVTGDDDPLVPPANSVLLARRLPEGRLLVVPDEGHLLLMDADSPALPPIHRFLTADVPQDAPAWRDAEPVGDEEVRRAIASESQTVQPWGVMGAFMRAAFPPVTAAWRSDLQAGAHEDDLRDDAVA